MSILKSALGKLGKASGEGFTPRANIPRSDVQSAVEYIMDNAENVGTPYAPTDAQYLTNGAVTGLSNERAVQDTATITWDWSTTGQAKANLTHLGIGALTDPGADRGMFWDDSEGAVKFFEASNGLGFVGGYLSITDADLHYIINTSFSAGDVLYHDGTTLQRLAAGSFGQVLRTQGAGAAPVWSTATGLGDMLAANNLADLANAATARDNLGVEIGADVQAYDATLASLSALGTAADRIAYTTGVDTWAETSITSFGRSLIDDADAATARSTLGLVIGTNVQAYDAELAALAGLTSAADALPYFTGSGTAATTTLTTFGRSLIDDADATTARSTLGLVIGTNVQAFDAELAAIAGLVSAADRLPYFTGSGTASLATFTSFGRSLVDDADATAARTTLGLGTMATETASNYLTTATAASTYQPLDTELTALAGLTSAADRLPYFTGSGTAALATFTTAGRNLLDDADASAQRTTLGLVIGTNVQAYSSVLAGTTASFTTAQETKLGYITVTQAVDLDAIESRVSELDAAVVLQGGWDASAGTFPGGGAAQAGWSYIVTVAGTVDSVAFSVNDRLLAYTDNASTSTYAANWLKLDYTDQVLSVAGRTGAVTIAAADITDSTANGRAILTAADYSAMRTLLSLVPGTNVQAYDAELAAISGLTSAADRLPYFTGSGTASLATFTSFGRTLVDDADATTARSTLGLVIGTDVQAYDAELAAIAGLTSAADRVPYFTGSGTAALATLTSFGRSLVDDADEATARATLGLTIGTHVQAYDELLAEIAALSTDPNADSGLFFDDSAGNVAYWTPTSGVEFSGTNLRMTANQRTGCITYVIDGGGSAITTGIKGDFRVPAACTVTGVTAMADQSGSIVVDIWKDTLANFPPTDADSITASAPVTISAATNSENTTLTGWTTALAAGDILRFNVDSVATIQRLTIELRVTKG